MVVPVSATVKSNSADLLQFPGLSFSRLRDSFGLSVTVLSGPHSGAKIFFPYKKKTIAVGRSIDNDVVLLGAEISGSHFTIVPSSPFRNSVFISSNNGSVAFDNGHTIHTGQRTELNLPAIVSFGDSSVLIDKNPNMNKVKRYFVLALLAVFSIFVGLLGANYFSKKNMLDIKPNSSFQMETISKVAALGSQSSSIDEIQKNQNETADQLREQIAKMGLDKYLSVRNGADGIVEIFGILPQKASAQWRSVLQWYDARPGMASMINNVSIRKLENLELTIKSVWLDANSKTVIMGDGQMVKEGEEVKGGWIIDEITSDYILVRKDSRVVKLTY